MIIVDRAEVITATEAKFLKSRGVMGCMVYIGGSAAGEETKSWTPAAVDLLRSSWSNFLPVYVDPTIGGETDIENAVTDAHDKMVEFGWHGFRGRVVMLDTERTVYESAPDKVFEFTQGFTGGITRAGYISAQYGPNVLLERIGSSGSNLPAIGFLPTYIQHTINPIPRLASRPELATWAHGARAGWQYANDAPLMPNHPVFDVSTVAMPLNP